MIDWSAPEDSIIHGLRKKRWVEVLTIWKRGKCQWKPLSKDWKPCLTWAMISFSLPLFDIDIHHSQNYIFNTSDLFKMKSSSTWVIPASLCEGPIFYFYVESVNLFPSVSSKHLSCCDQTIYMLFTTDLSWIVNVCIWVFSDFRSEGATLPPFFLHKPWLTESSGDDQSIINPWGSAFYLFYSS